MQLLSLSRLILLLAFCGESEEIRNVTLWVTFSSV